MKVKFNNGNPVILCENCSKILKQYKGENIKEDGSIENLLYFCSDKCSEEYLEKIKRKIIINK